MVNSNWDDWKKRRVRGMNQGLALQHVGLGAAQRAREVHGVSSKENKCQARVTILEVSEGSQRKFAGL